MTEEIKTEEKECKCFCKSEGVKKFVVVALGTFVGVYCALSLFAATHKPPCHMMKGPHMRPAIEHRFHVNGHRGDFQAPARPDRAPFERQVKEVK